MLSNCIFQSIRFPPSMVQVRAAAAAAAKSRLTHCDPVDCSPAGSSVHGILQARILDSVAISSSRGSSGLRDRTLVSGFKPPALAGGFFTTRATTWEAPIYNMIYPR